MIDAIAFAEFEPAGPVSHGVTSRLEIPFCGCGEGAITVHDYVGFRWEFESYSIERNGTFSVVVVGAAVLAMEAFGELDAYYTCSISIL